MCGAHTVVLSCDGDFYWLGQVFGGGGEGDLTPPWQSGEQHHSVLIALKVECPAVTQATRVRCPAEANLMHGIQFLFDPWIQDPE